MNTHHCSTENTQSICFKIKRELHNWSHYKKTEGYSFLFRKRAYGVIGKNTVPNCVIIISWFFSYQPTVRKTRFESVWQKHAVMWDVCLKRSSSDYLSPISFFMFGLLCNVALGGGKSSASVLKDWLISWEPSYSFRSPFVTSWWDEENAV